MSLVLSEAGSETFITLTTGENVSAFQAVAVRSDGLAYIADAATVADSDRTVGVAVTSALSGQSIQVQQVGTVNNLGWSFTPGESVYLGLVGALIQTHGVGAFDLSLGVALSASEFELQIGMPIILA